MQREIKITLENKVSRVFCGGSLSSLVDFAHPSKSVIVTDTNIYRYYGDKFSSYPVIILGTGEEIKNLSTVEYILKKMIQLHCTRKTTLIGIGGGIVSDIAGFSASIFMRGIPFGFVSTSLLSQVDASVGGKNGVNIDMTKNMAGVFSQPEFVICDHSMLATLPEEEYVNGLAELVKSALLEGGDFYSFITSCKEKIKSMDMETISEAIYKSILFKAKIVELDERERDLRRILNLGHTLGHAIEKVKGIKHGLAVSLGISFSISLSLHLAGMNATCAKEIIALLKFFNLPVDLKSAISQEDIPLIMEAVQADKKGHSSSVSFILLNEPGKPEIKEIDFVDFEKLLKNELKGGHL
ncbi:MAG TPA: 3-dehydroquinate synthase [Spirochaetota bacterium]|nr:3-dehydroquinate synthase [Spirochaetota bacterium]